MIFYKVNSFYNMFNDSKFNQPIGDWNVSNVRGMGWMFENSEFNQNISNWNISNNCATVEIFTNCPIKDEYKPKLPR